jgi:hypothetical protein
VAMLTGKCGMAGASIARKLSQERSLCGTGDVITDGGSPIISCLQLWFSERIQLPEMVEVREKCAAGDLDFQGMHELVLRAFEKRDEFRLQDANFQQNKRARAGFTSTFGLATTKIDAVANSVSRSGCWICGEVSHRAATCPKGSSSTNLSRKMSTQGVVEKMGLPQKAVPLKNLKCFVCPTSLSNASCVFAASTWFTELF